MGNGGNGQFRRSRRSSSWSRCDVHAWKLYETWIEVFSVMRASFRWRLMKTGWCWCLKGGKIVNKYIIIYPRTFPKHASMFTACWVLSGPFGTHQSPLGSISLDLGPSALGRISRGNWEWLGKQKRFLGYPQFPPVPHYALQRGYLLVLKVNKWKLSFLGSKLYLVIGVSQFCRLRIPTIWFTIFQVPRWLGFDQVFFIHFPEAKDNI